MKTNVSTYTVDVAPMRESDNVNSTSTFQIVVFHIVQFRLMLLTQCLDTLQMFFMVLPQIPQAAPHLILNFVCTTSMLSLQRLYLPLEFSLHYLPALTLLLAKRGHLMENPM